jgi:hypothetical protein
LRFGLAKLDIVTVNELLDVLLGSFIVGAHKLNSPEKMAISANNVRSMVSHALAQSPEQYCTLSIAKNIFLNANGRIRTPSDSN